MNLATLFEFAVERHPEREALVQAGAERFTYQTLAEEVGRVAAGLHACGVAPGDRVVVLLKNRIETVVLYWAVQRLGAVFTPINFRLSPAEVAYCLEDSAASVVVYEEVSESAVHAALAESRICRIGVGQVSACDLTWSALRSTAGEVPASARSEDDPCLMLYTSGTTGRPKGVPRTHRNEYSAALAHIVQNRYQWHECTLGVMPLYHTMGMRSLLSMMMLNGKLVMVPDYSSEVLLEAIERERVTCAYLVPTLIHDLVHHPHFAQYNLSSLTKLGYAGAAMTTALTQTCFEKLRPQVFVNHYGSTEVYTYTVCDYLDKKPGCAGKPGVHQRLRVVQADPEGRATPADVVPPGQPGEIIVDIRSDEAFRGYWNRPDATAKAIREGWYFTGDIGMIDEDGDLYVLGRVDDMIISGGENIHPIEVEDVLAKHPQVAEVAVVGLPDERWGEVVTAFVVRRDPALTAEDLDAFCKASPQLSNFKRPRKYVFVDALPKSPVGKILRRALRQAQTQQPA